MTRQYTFKLMIEEGYDEFWEDIEKRNVTGCEEVKQMVEDALFSVGLDVNYESNRCALEFNSSTLELNRCTLTLEKYENADV